MSLAKNLGKGLRKVFRVAGGRCQFFFKFYFIFVKILRGPENPRERGYFRPPTP
jgi:hypothetical protein